MKKTVTVILCLCVILSFAVACDNDEQTPVNSTPVVSEMGNFTEVDIALMIGGEIFYCGDDVTAILEKLGDDYEYSEAMSCAYDGMDKIFSYDDYDIYTYPDGDIDRVSEITIYSKEDSTTKGLKVGDSLDRAKELYGQNPAIRGLMHVYEIPTDIEGAQSASLNFALESGEITFISITAEILVE